MSYVEDRELNKYLSGFVRGLKVMTLIQKIQRRYKMKRTNLDSDVMWWLKMCLITGVTIPIVLIISFSVFALLINLLGLLGIDLKSVLALAR